jgi:hypothetical protein
MNTHGFWSYARQLLHAFADAGRPLATGPQLFLGPNGGLMWTDAAQVGPSQPYADAVLFSTPEESAVRSYAQSPAAVRDEPAESPLATPLEVPATN